MVESEFPYAQRLSDFVNPYKIPETETEAEYFESLGRFIAAYASAEASVHELTRLLSKLSEEKARVIFAGMRLGDLTDRIRAMARADKIDAATYAEIDACLLQLDLISDARNKLVHRTVNFFDGAFIVSNSMTAKTLEGREFHTFSRAELKAMRSDCASIFLRLLEIVRPSDPSADPVIPGFPSFLEYLKRPWRYTPAPPDTQKKQRRKAPESPKLRTPSSRERREAAMKNRNQ